MSKLLPSNSIEAAVRMHFGLTQAELARYLGITRGQVAHLEAGRRRATFTLNKRLWPLVELLPPPEGHGSVAPTLVTDVLPATVNTILLASLPEFGPLPSRPLRVRQRLAAAQAAALRWELHKETKRNAQQNRRQWGLTILQAALPHVALDAAEQVYFERWVQTLAADVAATTPTPVATAAHALAVLRVLVLEAEVAALDQLLKGASR